MILKRSRIVCLEPGLGFAERCAERAAVLDRMRHVAQVGLARVVHQRGEDVLDVTAALLDDARHDHRVLGDRIEDAAVATEPALVGQRPCDVACVELRGIGLERVHPAPGHRLYVGTRYGRRVVGAGGHLCQAIAAFATADGLQSSKSVAVASSSVRRDELRAFLRSRRARLSPADVGLPDSGGRRRTPGLRREELAALAGVGVSWYTWLEQGRDINPSPEVLDALARALRLDPAERKTLFALARTELPLADDVAGTDARSSERSAS